MAKHRGRGFATIEYPTGMNQNGDPSQAWIKLKPDGRVDVFAGTVVVNGSLQARARLDSGILSGSGQILGGLINVAGTVRPGGAGVVGTLTLGGDYVQQAGAALELDLASDSSYDKITAPSSNHTIAGSITISTIGGYMPTNGTDFFFFTQNANSIAITASCFDGRFASDKGSGSGKASIADHS